MSDGASGFRRLVLLTLRTCVRGLVIAVLAVVPGIPLFVASLASLPLLAGDRCGARADEPAGRAPPGRPAAPLGT